jgi:cytochrome P450
MQKRREDIKNNTLSTSENLLSILLTDELYMNDDEMIIDELMTMILAATQTTALTVTNSLYYINAHKKYLE